MHNEYYGAVSTPTTDFLAHYGVRGMKWGVRKAIQRGDRKAVSRQFRKAMRKLERLNEKANLQKQKEVAAKHNKRARIAAGVGAAGIGTIAGNNYAARKVLEAAGSLPGNYNGVRKKRIVGEGKGIQKGEAIGGGPVGNTTNTTSYAAGSTTTHPSSSGSTSSSGGNSSGGVNGFKVIRNIGAGMTAGGFATAAYQKSRAIAAKRRTMKKGHAKAVAKRDAWKREMDQAFKGTSYSKQRKMNQSRRKKTNG